VKALLGVVLLVAVTITYPWVMVPLWALLVVWVGVQIYQQRAPRPVKVRTVPTRPPVDHERRGALAAAWREIHAIEVAAGIPPTR
jgi:hypothetical protein